MKKLVLLLVVISIILLTSCGDDNQETPSEQTDTDSTAITEDDFNVVYDNITISDQVPFNDIANELGIDGEQDKNKDFRAANDEFAWYIVHYPSRDNEDLTIEYVLDKQTFTSYLVRIDLLNGETYRGIKVGDDLANLLQVYGLTVEGSYNGENEECFSYVLAGDSTKNMPDRTISVIVNTDSNKVVSIGLDYGSNEMMDKLGIVAFD